MNTNRIREVLRDIQEDMKNDANTADGKPFNGRTVAEDFGNQGAAIAALASIVDALVQDRATLIDAASLLKTQVVVGEAERETR